MKDNAVPDYGIEYLKNGMPPSILLQVDRIYSNRLKGVARGCRPPKLYASMHGENL